MHRYYEDYLVALQFFGLRFYKHVNFHESSCSRTNDVQSCHPRKECKSTNYAYILSLPRGSCTDSHVLFISLFRSAWSSEVLISPAMADSKRSCNIIDQCHSRSYVACYLSSPFQKLPPGPRRYPNIGNVSEIETGQWLKFAEWHKEYGQINIS